MNSKLNYVENWTKLAQETNWSVLMLAKFCNVSKRALEMHFNKHIGQSPKSWLCEQRQKKAMELLRRGSTVKEIAGQLGYKYPHHFSRDFKKYWGFCASQRTGAKTARLRK